MIDKKRYCVSYASGATGYGWRIETNDMREVKRIVRNEGRIITAGVDVFDRQKGDFIFMKRALDYKAEIDEIN